MKTTYAIPLLSAVLLTACSTSSLTDTQREDVTPTETAFSGEMKEIDTEASVISFLGKSNIINHEGKFNTYSASIILDPENPADLEKASIKAEIDITSAQTDAAGLDGHLKKADFFSAEEYPKATFESSSITNTGGNMYEVRGFLTVKGVSKTISFPAEITDEYLTATYDFPRKEFGVGNDNYGDKLLEETVPVEVKLVFKK